MIIFWVLALKLKSGKKYGFPNSVHRTIKEDFLHFQAGLASFSSAKAFTKRAFFDSKFSSPKCIRTGIVHVQYLIIRSIIPQSIPKRMNWTSRDYLSNGKGMSTTYGKYSLTPADAFTKLTLKIRGIQRQLISEFKYFQLENLNVNKIRISSKFTSQYSIPFSFSFWRQNSHFKI